MLKRRYGNHDKNLPLALSLKQNLSRTPIMKKISTFTEKVKKEPQQLLNLKMMKSISQKYNSKISKSATKQPLHHSRSLQRRPLAAPSHSFSRGKDLQKFKNPVYKLLASSQSHYT